jgi:hypothetical protein
VTRRLTAAALLAVAVLLTACGGSGDGDAAAEPDAPVSTSPSASPDTSPDTSPTGAATDAPPDEESPSGADSPPGEEPGDDSREPADDPPSPDEPLPPEGEFTDEQQEYLDGRMPGGADPGAILELGTEACDRLGYLDRHDPEAAVTALRAGDIPGAEEAIAHLCPQYADLLSEAQGEE